nr:MAG TPA: hypothetical protein [Caudoviricetes sp.]
MKFFFNFHQFHSSPTFISPNYGTVDLHCFIPNLFDKIQKYLYYCIK